MQFKTPTYRLHFLLLFVFGLFINQSAIAQIILTPTLEEEPVPKVDIVVENFDNLIAFQFSMHFDTSVLSLDSIGNEAFNGISFGTVNAFKGDVIVSWFDFFLQGNSIPDGNAVFSLYFTIKTDSTSLPKPHCFVIDGTPAPIEFVDINTMLVDYVITPSCFNLNGATVQMVVFDDQNNNCLFDANEQYLPGWGLTVERPGRELILSTGSAAEIFTPLDTYTYDIKLFPPSPYWTTCQDDYTYKIDSASFDTLHFMVPAQAIASCAYLTVDVSTPNLKKCEETLYYVNYANRGTDTARNSYIDIEFDPYLTVQSSSLPWSGSNGNNNYTFEPGDIAPYTQGTFVVSTILDEDCLAETGQTHCVEAHIYPDTTCFSISPDWSGAFIELSSKCEDGNIEFTLENVGDEGMAESATYIILKDEGEYFSSGTYQLSAGESMTMDITSDGATYRLQTVQVSNAPWESHPAISVEACGSVNSLGYKIPFPEDDQAHSRSIDCSQTTTQNTVVKKESFPEGVGNDHNTQLGLALEYKISFQNNSTDTVRNMVLSDTIPALLNQLSFVPGASSHPYNWTLLDNNVWHFEFNDINLPPKADNELLSEGFIKFTIEHQEDAVVGDVIRNEAVVDFDNQTPQITNEVFNTLVNPAFYHHFDATICEGDTLDGEIYTQSDTLLEVNQLVNIDSISITHIEVLPVTFGEIDTILPVDGAYEGIIYEQDTVIDFTLVNFDGCDSLLTVNIFITEDSVDAVYNLSRDMTLEVMPNPFDEKILISFDLENPSPITVIVRDLYGRTLARYKWASQQGVQRRELILDELTSGVYLLEVRTNTASGAIKVYKK